MCEWLDELVIEDFAAWREELLFTGAIIQDGDTSVDSAEAGRRCDRYLELLDEAEGSESQNVFQTLLDSMRVEEDYEVYEATLRVAFSFPAERLGSWLFDALPSFLARDPERANDWLRVLAYRGRTSPAVKAFVVRLEALQDNHPLVAAWTAAREAAERLGYR